jgi:hypothetical protein
VVRLERRFDLKGVNNAEGGSENITGPPFFALGTPLRKNAINRDAPPGGRGEGDYNCWTISS